VRQLGQSRNDVADGVNAGLRGLHEFIRRDESTISLDLGFFQANVVGAGRAAYCD
jgi:hypothetical protein